MKEPILIDNLLSKEARKVKPKDKLICFFCGDIFIAKEGYDFSFCCEDCLIEQECYNELNQMEL